MRNMQIAINDGLSFESWPKSQQLNCVVNDPPLRGTDCEGFN